MGLMVDRPTHYDDLTGRANAYFFARAYGMEEAKAEGALAELFEYFDLAEYADDRVKTYSYGMGKKLALIEALAHGPEVLLLDEPSLGLDYTSQLAYQSRIRDLAGSGSRSCSRATRSMRSRLCATGQPFCTVERSSPRERRKISSPVSKVSGASWRRCAIP